MYKSLSWLSILMSLLLLVTSFTPDAMTFFAYYLALFTLFLSVTIIKKKYTFQVKVTAFIAAINIFLINGNNVSSKELQFKTASDYTVVETNGELKTFEVDKIVTVTASIGNQSTNKSTVKFLKPYVLNKYGKKITILNESISGEDIEDLAARCDLLFDKYANEPNTRVLLHYGGGNINPSVKFLDQDQAVIDSMVNSLNYVYDSAELRGVKLIQAALSFRDYNSTTLKATPEEQRAYELGSYTYTRDWIVPIMKQRTPEFLDDNDWPLIDFYNLTRNHYGEWVDPYDELDRVHPSNLGRIIFSKYYVDSILALSKGTPLSPLPERDFNVQYGNATTPVDFVTGFGRVNEIRGNTAHINWVARKRPPTPGTEPVYLDNIIDTNGNIINGLKLYSFVNNTLRDGSGNLSDPANNTASLLNYTLLQSSLNVNIGSGSLYLVVEGLEPNKWYNISFIAGGENDSTRPRDTNIQVTNEDNEPLIMNCQASAPENNLVTTSFVTNSFGEALIASSEENNNNNSVMGGMRINTIK